MIVKKKLSIYRKLATKWNLGRSNDIGTGQVRARDLKGKGSAVEKRQFERKTLGGGNALHVSLFLNARSLVYEGRNDQFELEAQAVDISAGGVGLQLQFRADLLTLLPGHKVTVQLTGKREQVTMPATIAHFEQERGTMGLSFSKPIPDDIW